ncbi:septal ring lytic transglycosylase RlpA family protein [Pelobium manganitolerans]|uniref:septal ring lytic transglycosylase RlpA family protein n=1 Tax=Pelobium manganitolerans TaxID=1842495 RepID=UPI003FA3C14B
MYKILLLFFVMTLFACAPRVTQSGKASYYANKFNGRRTASGEKFRNSKLTAAHKTLPFGTKVKVTNLRNGKTVKVRINDRGPFVAGRIIDVSRKAAKRIGMKDEGVANVRISYKKH